MLGPERRTAGVLALAIGTAALVLLPTPMRAAVDDRGDEAKVLFVSARSSGEIYSVETDGSGETQITERQPGATNPAWSPDASRIAFDGVSGADLVSLWLVRADGSRLRSIGFRAPHDEGELRGPDWSPSGRRLAFSWREAIYVARASGKGPRRLTRRWDDAFDPAWSPYGRLIAFMNAGIIRIVDRNGKPQPIPRRYGLHPDWSPSGRRIVFADFRWRRGPNLYTMRADGTDRRLLFGTRRWETSPAWRPTGGRIALQRGRALWTIDPDGTDARRVARNAATPAWHPNRPLLVAARAGRREPFGEDEPATALVLVRADGTFVARLTTPVFDRDVAASPDGTRIAFTSYRPFGRSGVYVAASDGSDEAFVRAGRSPDWSPDGSRLLLEAEDGLVVVDPDGSNPVDVPLPAGLTMAFDPDPSWHPDGDRVSFVARQGGSCPAVWASELDGSNPTRMTPASCSPRLEDFDWAPSGASVYFSGVPCEDDDDCTDYGLYRVDGPNEVPVELSTPSDFDPGQVAVSPDGTQLAFRRLDFSTIPAGFEVWLANVDGTGARRLSRSGADRAPAWLPAPVPAE